MKILFVTPPPYLPNKLHRTRAFELIKMLSKKHNVHLLSITNYKKEPIEFSEIRNICKSFRVIRVGKFRSILNCFRYPRLPLEVSYCKLGRVQEEIEKIANKEKIDLVYLKRLRSAIYLPSLQIPVVLDTTDAMSMFYFRMFEGHGFPKSLLYLFEALKYRKLEKDLLGKIRNWVVCSDIDKKYLETLGVNANIYTVPNPVDVDYFQSSKRKYSGKIILFRGLMDKPVNIDAVLFFSHKIFPLVKKKIKDVKFYIIGPKPAKNIRKLNDGKNIFVKGYVEDMKICLENSTVCVCPIRIGSGTRHKILQAWSMGKPVISTSIGAEGLMSTDGIDVEIADDPKQFAQKIIRLLTDKIYYNMMAKSGRMIAEKRYSLQAVNTKLEQVLNAVRESAID